MDKTDVKFKRLRIGRDPSNEITINEASISRLHADLIYSNKDIQIRDLDSSNGTFLKKGDSFIKITNELVEKNDVLRFGKSKKEYLVGKLLEVQGAEILVKQGGGILTEESQKLIRCPHCAEVLSGNNIVCTKCGKALE